ncbi:MAG: ATP-binding protein [Clostridia bacterium]|nr:ATP-binding protein [Clostridia bacterium]
MAFNRADYVKIKKEYESKRQKARDTVELHRAQVFAKIPGMDEICRTIESAGPRAYEAAMKDASSFDEHFAEIKRQTQSLVAEQTRLLLEHGYPEDYLDLHYDCPLCRDEGNIDGKMCDCMRKALIKAGYVSSGISGLCDKMNFDTFDLSYYTGEARRNAELVLRSARRFAEEFHGEGSGSLLFMGGTGLGKTHLSVAVAKRVIERGYYTHYCTAEAMFSDYRAEKYRRFDDDSPVRTDKYTECELLVIDDLGTESGGRDVTPTLYGLVNARINTGLSTIISTNLSHKEMMTTYDERVASRLFGEYLPYMFTGSDVRMQKLRN